MGYCISLIWCLFWDASNIFLPFHFSSGILAWAGCQHGMHKSRHDLFRTNAVRMRTTTFLLVNASSPTTISKSCEVISGCKNWIIFEIMWFLTTYPWGKSITLEKSQENISSFLIQSGGYTLYFLDIFGIPRFGANGSSHFFKSMRNPRISPWLQSQARTGRGRGRKLGGWAP